MDINNRTLTSIEENVLKNELSDIQEWVNNAIDGKVNNCKLKMIAEWISKLNNDPEVESIPANDADLIALIVARDDYKNALTRESESSEPG